jgi:hypothetical protein
MKKIGILIPKLTYSLSECLSPIRLLHKEEVQNVSFDDFPESSFMREQGPELLKPIQEGNSQIAV